MNEKIMKAVKELREKTQKKNFSQSLDIIVNLKELDMKKSESKINDEVPLPHGYGEDAKVVVFSDNLSDLDCDILGSGDINRLAGNKRELKKLAQHTNFFLAEAPLMPIIGKSFGQILAPRQKMPKLVTGDVKIVVSRLKKSTKVKTKDAPVIQCIVGNEKMTDEQLAENVETIVKHLETKLPQGRDNIKEVLIKTTMGKPVRVEL